MYKAELGRLRERELRLLHVSELFILGLPDGGVRERKAVFFKKALAIAETYKFDTVVSFGRNGMSGHLDHIAAGEVARRLAKRLKTVLYTFTLPPELVPYFLERIKLRRRTPHYTRRPLLFAKPSAKVIIDTKVKLKAASFHKSQLGGKKPFAGFPEPVRMVMQPAREGGDKDAQRRI